MMLLPGELDDLVKKKTVFQGRLSWIRESSL